MAIIGFEQDPTGQPGMGMFQFDNGAQVYGHDPQAAAPFLQQPQQPAPPPLAQIDPGIVTAAQQPAGGARFAGPGAGPQELDADAPDFVSPKGETQQASVQTAAPQPSAPQDPIVAEQEAAAAYGGRKVKVAATKGGFKPKTGSESVETSAMPFTEEDAAARRKLAENEWAAQMSSFGNQAAQQQAQQAAYQAALPALQVKQQKAEAIQAQIDQQYQQDRANVAQLEQNYDPDHFWHEKSTGQSIGLLIFQGLSAYASAKLKSDRNPVTDMINQEVNHDIQAQQQKISGAYKHLDLTYRDRDQAVAGAKLAADKVVQQQIAAAAAGAQSKTLIEAAQKWSAEWDLKIADDERNFHNASFGKHTQTIQQAYQAPSAGGYREPTEAEKQGRLKTLEMLGGVQKQTAETEKIRAEAAGVGKKETDAGAQHISDKTDEAKIPQALSAIDGYEKMLTKANGSAPAGLGPVTKHLPEALLSDEGQRNRRVLQSTVITVAQAKGRLNESEKDLVQQAELGNASEASMQAFLVNAREELRERQKNIRAGATPEAVRAYESRGGLTLKKAPPPGAVEVE